MLQLNSTDLNDPSTLELYSQILLFNNNHAGDGLVFYGPDKYRQWIFQSLAHKLDLECEYTLATRTLKINRPTPESGIDPEVTNDDSSFGDLLQNIGGAFGDALHNTAMSSVLSLERISLSPYHNMAWMLQSLASLITYWDSLTMKLWPRPLPGLTVLPCLSRTTCQVPQIGLGFRNEQLETTSQIQDSIQFRI